MRVAASARAARTGADTPAAAACQSARGSSMAESARDSKRWVSSRRAASPRARTSATMARAPDSMDSGVTAQRSAKALSCDWKFGSPSMIVRNMRVTLALDRRARQLRHPPRGNAPQRVLLGRFYFLPDLAALRWARYSLIFDLAMSLCFAQTIPKTGAATPVQPGTGQNCLGRRLTGAATAGAEAARARAGRPRRSAGAALPPKAAVTAC